MKYQDCEEAKNMDILKLVAGTFGCQEFIYFKRST